MSEYKDLSSYRRELQARSLLPQGFSAASVPLSFFPKEKRSEKPYQMNLTALLLNRPTEVFAAVYTRNKSPGAPVLVGRELLKARSTFGVLVNNKIANVCAPGGKNAATRVVDAFSKFLGQENSAGNRESGVIFPSSTGIIGWELPVEAMEEAAEELANIIKSAPPEELSSMFPVAEGIMTTDAFPKLRSIECGKGRIVAAAKGAGMIEPNMATLLVFIATDITVSRGFARAALERAVAKSFNLISVDGDQSTSDTALLFSSCCVDGVPEADFERSLTRLCRQLSEDIVRNGEGTNHVIRVKIRGAENNQAAAGFGKAVVNSSLVKAAVYGNDPNVGRIIMALGDYAGNNGVKFYSELTQISIGEIPVFRDGVFLLNEEKETMLHAYLKTRSLGEKKEFPPHERAVDIDIDVNCGDGIAEILGSDLSYEYVRENADYRS